MRKRMIAAFALLGVVLSLGACSDKARDEVVLYSSVDETYLRPILETFESQTGIAVRYVGDTEATKSFGLVERLIDEQDAPRADVWWSSEQAGTMRLAGLGVLAPYTSDEAEGAFSAGWPAQLRGVDRTWYGFALRARVFVINTEHMQPGELVPVPAAMADPRLKGRIGMANPRFGTTRAHMGALLASVGEERFVAWLNALRDNDVRILPGNSDVVRAVATGELYVGLTDTDDVRAGLSRDWPIEAVFERRAGEGADALAGGMGAVLVPNTAGLVAGGPNPENAARLLAFILSPAVERALAESESGNMPVRPALADEFGSLRIPDPARVSPGDSEASMDRAVELCVRVLGL